MLALGIIQPSHSPWGAPRIQVRKPLEKGIPQPPRFVVDYRGLNAITSGDGYPIPSVSNILDALSGGKLFAKLDLASGYWQVPVNPAHVHKTAFATHLGLYEFLRMPFGLKTAPHTFQRILNTVFSDYFSVSPCLVLPQTQIGFQEEIANFLTTPLRYIHINNTP